jgi:hypothetical protein
MMTRATHKTVPNSGFWSGYIDCDGWRLHPDAKVGPTDLAPLEKEFHGRDS